MDLILLEPGNATAVFGNDKNSALADGGLLNTPREGISAGQCIELVSIHQGMKQQMTTDVSNSARTTGRPVITEFTCVKYVDATSAKLYELCLRGQPLGNGADQPTKLYIGRRASDKAALVMTFWLRDALISEIQLQTHPNDLPTEQFKLNFTEILWSNAAQPAAPAPGHASAHVSGWSLMRNRPITGFSG